MLTWNDGGDTVDSDGVNEADEEDDDDDDEGDVAVTVGIICGEWKYFSVFMALLLWLGVLLLSNADIVSLFDMHSSVLGDKFFMVSVSNNIFCIIYL